MISIRSSMRSRRRMRGNKDPSDESVSDHGDRREGCRSGSNSSHAVNVEDIQNMVETGIMEMRGYEVAQKYVRYRFKRELRRNQIRPMMEFFLYLIILMRK